MKENFFDVIVIGGGHAGIEAALASSRMKCKVLLLTSKIDALGELSCNPSIGGVGKGHLVKEIDAMGGGIGLFADLSGINFKLLNLSKGYAVQSTRIQVDRFLYKMAVLNSLKKINNIVIIQQTVIDLIIKNNQVIGVFTEGGYSFFSKACILTLGTFLNGKIFIGNLNYPGGRMNDMPSNILASKLKYYFPIAGRLKTGTPPRIDIRSVNLRHLSVQKSDCPIPFFSFWYNSKKIYNLKECYLTYTNNNTHNEIFNSLHLSAIYNGSINVFGPRYCPSIEDKIVRFKNKLHHQIFLEPEGLNSFEFYPNGISTSLPPNIQIKFLKTIRGFQNIHITRYGYAVEYDFFDPRLLKKTLESKIIKNLFFAGQINGTTGYEEAAAQGLVAGINSACLVLNKEFLVFSRLNSYIGVLIDDLVTKGVDEPYRMLTSRSEYRLSLREDNADIRLTPVAKNYGLINEYKWKKYLNKYDALKKYGFFLRKTQQHTSFFYEKKLHIFFGIKCVKYDTILDLFKKQYINYKIFISMLGFKLNSKILKLIEIKIKYSGYFEKQYSEIKIFEKYLFLDIPKNINYFNVSGLSLEISEKLNLIRPKNLDQAFKIPGINISSLLILLVYIKKIMSNR